MSQQEGSSNFGWFLAGVGIGSVIGLLYAPQSGSETREVLRSKAEESKEFLRNKSQDVRDQASDWVDKGKNVINDQKENIRSAVEAGKQAYRETTSPLAEDGVKKL